MYVWTSSMAKSQVAVSVILEASIDQNMLNTNKYIMQVYIYIFFLP